jgi:Clp amino terminal domain, pathogenicity island component
LAPTLDAALRRGHDSIGTEHILLGILAGGGEAAARLNSLGLTQDVAEQALAAPMAAIQAALGRRP